MTHKDIAIFERLMERVERAERLHPVFAEGVYHALGFLGEEHGEVVKVVTKKEGDQRLQDELFDLLVVTWRFIRKDYEQEARP